MTDAEAVKILADELNQVARERAELRGNLISVIEMICIGLGCEAVRQIIDRFEKRNKL